MKRTNLEDHAGTITAAVALAKSRGEVALQPQRISELQSARKTVAKIFCQNPALKLGSPASIKLNRAADLRDQLLRQVWDFLSRASVMLLDQRKATKADQGDVRGLLTWLAAEAPHKLRDRELDNLIRLVRA